MALGDYADGITIWNSTSAAQQLMVFQMHIILELKTDKKILQEIIKIMEQ